MRRARSSERAAGGLSVPLGSAAEGGALLGLVSDPDDARPGAVVGRGARVGAIIS